MGALLRGVVLLLVLTFPAGWASAAEEADTLALLTDGKALLEKKCKFCHSLARALAPVKERAEWSETVKRMVTYGASLNAKQRESVTAYLSARSSFERHCNACHSSLKVISDGPSTMDWKMTVKRMAEHLGELSKKNQDIETLSDGMIEEIAAFLTLVVPPE